MKNRKHLIETLTTASQEAELLGAFADQIEKIGLRSVLACVCSACAACAQDRMISIETNSARASRYGDSLSQAEQRRELMEEAVFFSIAQEHLNTAYRKIFPEHPFDYRLPMS